MSEVNFSKKQITPLMEKYSINAENENFKAIITMFNGQTPYQIWAIGAVFSGATNLDTIKTIKNWADANQTEIHNLARGTIVAYKSTKQISDLMKEIRGLDMLSAVRGTINKFNTAQRELLRANVLDGVNNGIDAATKSNFKSWYELFKKMELMPKHKKEKLISLASAINDISFLRQHISDALLKSYEWNREDMLAYMHNNANDCEVVFDEGDVVIITVPSFDSSKKMCGNGRTGWCITRENRYFNQYVIEPANAKQYMLFNFNLKENHELAHIGFTVREGYGITNAHSTKNNSMTGSGFSLDGKNININTALEQVHVPKSVYVKLRKLTKYKWEKESLLEFIKAHSNQFAISVDANNRVIVRAMSSGALSSIISHTLVDTNNLSVNNDNKVYILFDFNLDVNDDNSVVVLAYRKDKYKCDTLNLIRDAYNIDITKSGIMNKLGIPTDAYLNREDVPKSILLHKYIDEGNEKEAIETINKYGDDVDINFELNNNTPIFNAVDKGMYDLFVTIINHPKFDCSNSDGYGETILTALLYNYKDGIKSETENKNIKKMIDLILSSETFDFNSVNINLDTALSVACERTDLNWVVDALVAKANVDVNTVNDIDYSTLGNAIRRKNTHAIGALMTRHDLRITDKDMECAKANGIDLSSFTTSTITTVSASETRTSDLYSELFARAFARRA